MNDPQILPSVISFIGVLISIILSAIFSWRTVRLELTKIKHQNLLAHSSKLLEKRLEKYPALYEILSGYGKKVRDEGITLDDLQETFNEIRKWDTQHSILFSGKTVFTMISLFDVFRSAINRISENENQSMVKDEVYQLLGQMELALKSDIGVFLVEFPDANNSFFENYFELNKKSNKK